MCLRGVVTAILRGPDGKIKQKQVIHNLITDQGDDFAKTAWYTGAYTGWGMKLGTASTPASKDGAGSYIATGDYVTGSAKVLDDGTPKQDGGNANILQFRRQWAAGEGTDNTINRVAIVDNTSDAGEADATGTFAIAVFTAQIAKGANDTLTVTWDCTFLGA